MFKTNRNLIVSASVAVSVALLTAGCLEGGATPSDNNSLSKASIDGGVSYPLVNGKTSVYLVNEQNVGMKINNGRAPTENELKAWDKDVMPDGTGLPEGEGSVEEGEELYEAKCVMCHGDFGSGGGGYPSLSKGNAVDLQKTLVNQRNTPDADGPVRVFGSYWPKASTMWWYIKDGMPHTKSKTLTDDETYALAAYMLNINEMSIDGEEVDDEYVLNREKFLKIKMPNRDGFIPNIDGPNGPENVRKFYANPNNFGAQKVANPAERCMTNCQDKTAKVVHIQNGGITDFEPPISVKRDLPKKEASDMGFNVMANYENNCMPCHGADGMGAPVMGDKDAWGDVISKGMTAVYKNGLNGINGMPAKGGASVSDDEFKLLVDYMIDHSK